MQYDVSAEVKAQLCLRPAQAGSPEEAAARALGGLSREAREQLRQHVVGAVRSCLARALKEHNPDVPFELQVDFSLVGVGWGGDEDLDTYDDYAEPVGECEGCGTLILNREIEGHPYTYGMDEGSYHTYCYPCHQRLKPDQDASETTTPSG